MPLSWNEIKSRATEFSKVWNGTTNEDAEAKPFLEAFFNVFGITRKKVAMFEYRVNKLDKHDGYIDLFWKGTLLVEMKSADKDLDKALIQAREYLQSVKQEELPRYIMLCDFKTFRLIDVIGGKETKFALKDLVNNVNYFGFIAGYQQHTYKEQDPVNIEAAELMGKLHDKLKEVGYDGHNLEIYLVRLLFCLFADDTTIFNKDIFSDYISQRTSEDGSDLAAKISELFFVLNTPEQKRYKTLDEQLKAFPYINGKLFEEQLPPASFDAKMRDLLLECCYLNWGEISPAIFGSMFQSVMNPIQRRNFGAHYTSEKNILKLIKPLFLDAFWEEFDKVKGNRLKVNEFHKKLASLKFLDPACGCGNFLVITYRELRLLELEILKELYKGYKDGIAVLNIADMLLLDVDMMYGIEIEEFPAQIAQVAMWLIDHQMNMAISQEFGQYFARLPLKKAATIINDDALELNWELIVNPKEISYIIGNPPFMGANKMGEFQRSQIVQIFNEAEGIGVLDYVTGWYIKAAKFIQGTNIKVAFVSTNSIVQGEQTSLLWRRMIEIYDINIHFAHRTFRWRNEASGNAAVYCVIIGFANFDTDRKLIFDYDDVDGDPHEYKAKNINPYLSDSINIFIDSRSKTLCSVPKILKGSQPTDSGNLLFTDDEKIKFIENEPNAEKWIKPFISAKEFLNNEKRWCLWLVGANPKELKEMPLVMERVAKVRMMRLASVKQATVKWADLPTLFTENRQPNSNYVLIPSHSSENRKYIPIGFFTKNDIANNSCLIIPNATLFIFGMLTSKMHMAWVKTVCGRIKSDFRYSNDIVYNNYPFPTGNTETQIKAVETAAQAVLDARNMYPDSSLADLYDTLAMPLELVKAHNKLDIVVDKCYGTQKFKTDLERVSFLFTLYESYTAELFTSKPEKKKKTKKEI